MSVPGKNESSAEGNLLDVPRIDLLYAVDILKIELELVDDEPLDLIGTHADVIEEDVDLRDVQRRENIDCIRLKARTPPLIKATTSIRIVMGAALRRR